MELERNKQIDSDGNDCQHKGPEESCLPEKISAKREEQEYEYRKDQSEKEITREELPHDLPRLISVV